MINTDLVMDDDFKQYVQTQDASRNTVDTAPNQRANSSTFIGSDHASTNVAHLYLYEQKVSIFRVIGNTHLNRRSDYDPIVFGTYLIVPPSGKHSLTAVTPTIVKDGECMQIRQIH